MLICRKFIILRTNLWLFFRERFDLIFFYLFIYFFFFAFPVDCWTISSFEKFNFSDTLKNFILNWILDLWVCLKKIGIGSGLDGKSFCIYFRITLCLYPLGFVRRANAMRLVNAHRHMRELNWVCFKLGTNQVS